MKKRVSSILLVCLLTIFMISGCGAKSDGAKSDETTPDTDQGSSTEQESGTEQESAGADSGGSFRIGVLLPLSGANAHEGEVCRNAMQFAADKINDAGGIKSLGGKKLELIFGDHTADAQVAITEMERIILNEKVEALLGPYNSAVGYTTAQVAEKYGLPYLLNNSVADDILMKGYKWVFRANQTSSSNAVDQLKFLKDISQEQGKEFKNIALVYENTEWGASAAKAIQDLAEPEGFKIVLYESYPANTPDMTSLVIKLKNSGADVVIPDSYLNDALLFMKTMKEMEVNIPVFAGGGGFTDPEFIKQAGKNAENMFILMAWSTDILAKKEQWATDYNNEFKEKYGYDFAEISSNSYQNVYILADALERAASTDPEAIRQALLETDIKDGEALINPYVGIKFGTIRGMENQNIYSQMLVSQVQSGNLRVVWPKAFSPDDVKLIMP